MNVQPRTQLSSQAPGRWAVPYNTLFCVREAESPAGCPRPTGRIDACRGQGVASRVPPEAGTFSSFLLNRIDADSDAFIQCSACSVWPSLQVLASPQSQSPQDVEGLTCGVGALSGLFDPDPTFQISACLFPQHSRESCGSRATWAF